MGGAFGVALSTLVYTRKLIDHLAHSNLSPDSKRSIVSNTRTALKLLLPTERSEASKVYMEEFFYVLLLWYVMFAICRGTSGYVKDTGMVSPDEHAPYGLVEVRSRLDEKTIESGVLTGPP